MAQRDRMSGLPGLTILGGSAGGLSYEGALRDALARPDADWKREARNQRRSPPPQAQAQSGAVAEAPAAVQQQGQRQQ